MSFPLIILSVIIIALAVVPLISPMALLEYPFVLGVFLAVWLLPQTWAVEINGLSAPFDPTEAWIYMSLCMIFLCAGYVGGRLIGKRRVAGKSNEQALMYNEKRMTQASAALIAIGAISYVMMTRTEATTKYEAGWTGIIVFYAQFATCLVSGAALTFLIYLRTLDKSALILSLISTAIYLPVLIISIKREYIFDFGVIIFGGLFLVRKVAPSRAVLIALCLIGAFIVNRAGDIRGYVKDNDSSLIGALTSAEVLSGSNANKSGMQAAEVTGAVTDIAIASEVGGYRPFANLYNAMVSRYVPSFIFGRDLKNAVSIQMQDYNPLSNRARSNGATRTGFSDTFMDYWYFGTLAFAGVGMFFGWLYSFAMAGGLRDQYLFVSLLGGGLHAITHGVQEFVSGLPFIFLIVWLPFRYARITPKELGKLALSKSMQTAS